jgi:hypothetical protein
VSSPIWGSWPDIYYYLTVTVLFLWGALSDKRTDLSFVYAADHRQCSLSWVRVPWDLWLYFTVSELRLPFSSPPTTRRVTVEVFVPASTRVGPKEFCHLYSRGTHTHHSKHMSRDHYSPLRDVTADKENKASIAARWTVFTEVLFGNALIKSVTITIQFIDYFSASFASGRYLPWFTSVFLDAQWFESRFLEVSVTKFFGKLLQLNYFNALTISFHRINNLIFMVPAAVTMVITVFWDVTTFSSSKTLVTTHQSTRHNMQGYSNLRDNGLIHFHWPCYCTHPCMVMCHEKFSVLYNIPLYLL